MFTLGFYTYQTEIWRSIPSAGSVDSPFGCYPISLGRRSSHRYSITFPGFLPRKRMFQSNVRAAAPRLICELLTTALIYSKFYTSYLVFLIQPFLFKFLLNFPTKANWSLACNGQGKLSRAYASALGLDTMCPSIVSDHICFGFDLRI